MSKRLSRRELEQLQFSGARAVTGQLEGAGPEKIVSPPASLEIAESAEGELELGGGIYPARWGDMFGLRDSS